MPSKKETKTEKESSMPEDEIKSTIKIAADTSSDVIGEAAKAAGTVVELAKQTSKLAASLGLGTTGEAAKTSKELTKEMGEATNTMMKSSIEVINAGSDAVKTTAHITVKALNGAMELARDLTKLVGGVIILTGGIVAATGEIVEVSGRMVKTLGRLVESSGRILK